MSSRVDGTSKMLRGVNLRNNGHVRRCRSAGRCLLAKSALLLARCLVHASLSCLIAAHDGVRTWQVRDAKVEEGGKMRCQVERPKAHVSIVELVATVGLDPPGVRMTRHDDETRAFTTSFVQAAEAPQERVAGRRKLWVLEHVTDSGEGTRVEVASSEVDVVLHLVGVEAL